MRVAPPKPDCTICQQPERVRIPVNAAIWDEQTGRRTKAYRSDAVALLADFDVRLEAKSVTRHADHVEASWRDTTPAAPAAGREEALFATDFASVADEAAKQPSVLERAFPALGEQWNADLIRHLAMRWTSVYEELMGWAAHTRGIRIPAVYRRTFDLLARLVDQPLKRYRAFVGEFVSLADRIPQLVADGQSEPISMVVNLTIDENLLRALSKELRSVTDRVNQGAV